MVPISPTTGGQNTAGRGMAPTFQVESHPWSPLTQAKIGSLAFEEADLGQAQTPQLCKNQGWEPPGLGRVHPPATSHCRRAEPPTQEASPKVRQNEG